MSVSDDINGSFEQLLVLHPKAEKDILYCKFSIFASLKWKWAASDVVKEIIDAGFEINENMEDYMEDFK